jgi:hypothetical protein
MSIEKDITPINTGYVPDPKDSRDYNYEQAFGGVPVIDWEKGFSVEDVVGKLPHIHQKNTLPCVSCAWSKYHRVLRRIYAGADVEFSVRDLYSQIFIPPNGGAYLRDGGLVLKNKGQVDEINLLTPPWTEEHLRDRSDIEASDIEIAKTFMLADIFRVNSLTNIDMLADAIQRGYGIAMASSSLAHAMYGKAFHMHDGEKCLILHNSFGDSAENYSLNDVNGDVHFKESRILTGDISDAWTAIIKKNDMYNIYFAPNSTEVWAVKPGIVRRHIANSQTLVLGSKDPDKLWFWSPETVIPSYPGTEASFLAITACAEIHLDPIE